MCKNVVKTERNGKNQFQGERVQKAGKRVERQILLPLLGVPQEDQAIEP